MEPKLQPFLPHAMPAINGDDGKKHPLSDQFKALVMYSAELSGYDLFKDKVYGKDLIDPCSLDFNMEAFTW